MIRLAYYGININVSKLFTSYLTNRIQGVVAKSPNTYDDDYSEVKFNMEIPKAWYLAHSFFSYTLLTSQNN
jgi:hypothetical protein